MFLMWLGSLAILFAGLFLSSKALQSVLAPLRERSLDSLQSKDFKAMLVGAFLYVLGTGHEQESATVAVSAYNFKLSSRRAALLLLCLSLMGLWWPLILMWGYLQYNGLLLIGVAALLWILPWNTVRNMQRRQAMIEFFFGVGLFYFGAEQLLKNSSLLINLLGQSEFAFWIVEKSLIPLLSLSVMAFVLGCLIRIPFYSVALSLVLMMSGSLTFQGALFLFLGERLYGIFQVYWIASKADRTVQSSVKWWAIVSLVGLLLGTFAMVTASLNFNWGAIYGVEPAIRNQQYITTVAIVLLFQFVAQMAWGHFASPKKETEMSEVAYIDWASISGNLSESSKEWLQLGLNVRLKKIDEHLAELNGPSANQIPESVKLRLREEHKALSALVQN